MGRGTRTRTGQQDTPEGQYVMHVNPFRRLISAVTTASKWGRKHIWQHCITLNFFEVFYKCLAGGLPIFLVWTTSEKQTDDGMWPLLLSREEKTNVDIAECHVMPNQVLYLISFGRQSRPSIELCLSRSSARPTYRCKEMPGNSMGLHCCFFPWVAMQVFFRLSMVQYTDNLIFKHRTDLWSGNEVAIIQAST